jgi:hypothetical protein
MARVKEVISCRPKHHQILLYIILVKTTFCLSVCDFLIFFGLLCSGNKAQAYTCSIHNTDNFLHQDLILKKRHVQGGT